MAARPQLEARFEAEARERWSSSPAWKESQRRAASWSAEDKARIKTEMDAIFKRLAGCQAGSAGDPETQAAVRAYHEYIDRQFYSCPVSMFLGLSDLWVEDERFAATWESFGPGLANFLHEAVRIYVEELLLVNERY